MNNNNNNNNNDEQQEYKQKIYLCCMVRAPQGSPCQLDIDLKRIHTNLADALMWKSNNTTVENGKGITTFAEVFTISPRQVGWEKELPYDYDRFRMKCKEMVLTHGE